MSLVYTADDYAYL
jgi:hypothetical protein